MLKRKKFVNIIVTGTMILLCLMMQGCGFNNGTPPISKEEDSVTMDAETTGSEIIFQTPSTDHNIESNNQTPIAEIPEVTEDEVSIPDYPEQTDYDSIAVLAVEPVEEEDGTYGGSPVVWSKVNDGKFLHFYYSFTYPERSEPEHAGFAIIGEEVPLPCGIQVGMSAQEAEKIIPGLYHFVWNNESVSVWDWNCGSYPDGWCEQFNKILIAEVKNDSEMPKTIGLLLDAEDMIRAIAFNYPTAG